MATVTTDARGDAGIDVAEGLSAPCTVVVRGNGLFGVTPEPVHTGEWPSGGLPVVVAPTVVARGTLSAPPGCTGLAVTCWMYDKSGSPHRVSSTTSNRDGGFVLPCARGVPSSLTVSGEGIAPVLVKFRSTGGATVHEAGTVSLAKGELITGTVLGRRGQRVRKARVRLVVPEEWSVLYPTRWKTVTFLDGRFSIEAPPADTEAPTIVVTFGSTPEVMLQSTCTVTSVPITVRIDVP
jgi:hypothetical protein